jgi:hypothetical protein
MTTVYERTKDNANQSRHVRGKAPRGGHDGTAFMQFESMANDLEFDPCSHKIFNDCRKRLFGKDWKKARIVVERISR